MAKSSTALALSKKPAKLDLTPKSAAVSLLGSSSRNLDLDFWAQVILSENRHLTMGIEEMRERIVARIEEAILRDEQPSIKSCKALGVPSFIDLVNANHEVFSTNVVAKVRAEFPS